MAKSTTTVRKPARRKAVAKKVTSLAAKRPLASMAKAAPRVNSGGLDLNALLVNVPERVARSTTNAERHLEWNGKTVREVLEQRLGDARDIRYDLDKGFMTLGT
jgi:hypothetical protein